MTIASQLKLNIWLSTAVVLLLITACAAALLIEQKTRERSLFADQLLRGVFDLSLLTDYYLRHPETRPKVQWQIQHAALLKLLQEKRAESDEKVRREFIQQSLSDIDALFQKLTKTYASGHADDTLARQQREQLADLIIIRSRTIAETTARMAAESRADMAVITRRIAMAFPVLSLLVLAMTVWLATRIRNRITGPIEQLRHGAAILGTGQLDYHIGLAPTDELGQLAGEFDRMAERLKTTTASRHELLQEVTERQRVEEALRQFNADLEQRVKDRTVQLEAINQELKTFTYSVSHDLKAPLRGIDGYSRLLLEDYAARLDAEGRTFLGNVRQGVLQMNTLIDDLLTYSRMERRALHAQPVELLALIHSVVTGYGEDIQARGVELHVSVPSLTVRVDREGLALVVRNLLDNALKFTQGVTPPVIEIRGRNAENKVILAMSDNGIGFDMKFHDRIFEIFQRLHRSEDYPGTGIGLALVRRAMQRMGGRVWAHSRPGGGATFYLEFPR